MTLNIVMSFVVLAAVIAFAAALMYALIWIVMRISAAVPYTGKKHRHARWGEDLTRPTTHARTREIEDRSPT